MIRIEEIADNLFALSHVVPVNGRSWRPPGTAGFEPFNVYLALSGADALLLDTGPPAHREALLDALDRMLGGRRLTVMATRSELECISNIGAICDRFPVSQVLGTMKNLPILGLVHFERKQRADITAGRMPVGRTLAEFGFDRFRPMEPVIKTLSTVWTLDEASGALLTSDFFSGDLLSGLDQSVVRRDREGAPPPHELRRHILSKFDWLERADTTRLRDAWDRFFADVHPRLLAPGLGRIQYGSDLAVAAIEDYRAAVFGPA